MTEIGHHLTNMTATVVMIPETIRTITIHENDPNIIIVREVIKAVQSTEAEADHRHTVQKVIHGTTVVAAGPQVTVPVQDTTMTIIVDLIDPKTVKTSYLNQGHDVIRMNTHTVKPTVHHLVIKLMSAARPNISHRIQVTNMGQAYHRTKTMKVPKAMMIQNPIRPF